MISQYKVKVEPMKYSCYLIMGLLTTGFSTVIFIHLWLAGSLRFGIKQVGLYLNQDVEEFYSGEGSRYLGVILFLLICAYMFLATLHGNIKFGLRFFTFTFYPLVPQETFMNSFLINAFLMNVYMHSLIYLIVDLFRQFVRGTEAAFFFQVVAKNQEFYAWAFQRQLFNTALIVWTITSLIYFSLKPREKIDDKNLTKRKDLSAK